MLVQRESAKIASPERRSRLGLYVDILRVVANGTTKPTRILFEARLSWVSMQKAMDFLIENELIMRENIEDDEPRRGAARDGRLKQRYLITSKGLVVLKFFDKEQVLADLLTQ